MASFSLFPNLPGEIQDKIWEFSVDEPQPGVCVWDTRYTDDSDTSRHIDESHGPPSRMVVTTWPSAASVCRRSRAALSRISDIRMLHSKMLKRKVPCRPFDPSIDALYWSSRDFEWVVLYLISEQGKDFALSLRHVAMEGFGKHDYLRLALLFCEGAVKARTLSLVLSGSGSGIHSMSRYYEPPMRPCRLREIPRSAWEGITLMDLPRNETRALRGFVRSLYSGMEREGYKLARDSKGPLRAELLGGDDSAWVARWKNFLQLKVHAQILQEYRDGEWDRTFRLERLGNGLGCLR